MGKVKIKTQKISEKQNLKVKSQKAMPNLHSKVKKQPKNGQVAKKDKGTRGINHLAPLSF